jgi:hypothetical protein
MYKTQTLYQNQVNIGAQKQQQIQLEDKRGKQKCLEILNLTLSSMPSGGDFMGGFSTSAGWDPAFGPSGSGPCTTSRNVKVGIM